MDQIDHEIPRTQSGRSLPEEAERRIRSGETFKQVSLGLLVPLSTLHRWAALGGWRRKDQMREEEGLPPLPSPAYARRNYRKHPPARQGNPAGLEQGGTSETTQAGNQDVSVLPDADKALLDDLAALQTTAEHHGLQALKYFQSGHRAKAEAQLKEVDRLTRLHRRLMAHVPSEPTEAELDRLRIEAMTDEELIAEIKRRAGVIEKTNG
ncbi:MAG: hypothetical protein AAF950_00960 [Pseudomonadota bacterium]